MKRAAVSVARGFGVALLGAVALSAPGARANGVFPSVSQLVAEPSDAQHLVLRSTFGLMISRDGGQSWDWLCEEGLGYQNIEPPIAVLPGGYIIMGLPTGVSVGDKAGCDFHLASGISANVSDVSVELAVPGGAVAMSVNYDPLYTQVWETTDNGQSWSTLGAKIPGLEALTIDVAKDDAGRIYLSGTIGDNQQNALLVSSDHGKSWVTRALPGPDLGGRPYIGGISPLDEDTVYLRLNTFPGLLEVTTDAGKTFVTALTADGPIQGFAISPDGKTLVASSTYSGMYRGNSATLEFEHVACDGTSCLSWSDAGLLGCGNEFTTGFALGRSTDEGANFAPALNLLCVRGSVACGADTSTAVCSEQWSTIQGQLAQSLPACEPDAPGKPFSKACLAQGGETGSAGAAAEMAGDGAGPSPAGGAPDASVSAGASGGERERDPSGSSAAGAAGEKTAVSDRHGVVKGGGGCACSITPLGGQDAGWLGLLAAFAFLCVRRSVHPRRHATLASR